MFPMRTLSLFSCYINTTFATFLVEDGFIFQCCNKWSTASQMAPCERGHSDERSHDVLATAVITGAPLS